MPPRDLPFPPMEAELVRDLPAGEGWLYEPKWDGFRGVLENLDGELALWSRNERPLLRYFPELGPLGDTLPARSALDGEIVIEREGALDFDALQMRLHPAESRIRRLSAEIPARYVAFDVLVLEGEPIHELPLEERKKRLAGLGFETSPASGDVEEAQGWLERLDAAGFDGVIAKRLGVPYLPGSREAVVKVKAHRSADCVVVGLRYAEGREQIKTLLLGLYDEGELRYVGSTAVGAKRQEEVAERVRPLLRDAPDRRFSEPNRWGGGELEEAAVRPQLVVEARYDKWQGQRFRHGMRFLRWRLDKDPEACTVEQVRDRPAPGDPTVSSLLAANR